MVRQINHTEASDSYYVSCTDMTITHIILDNIDNLAKSSTNP